LRQKYLVVFAVITAAILVGGILTYTFIIRKDQEKEEEEGAGHPPPSKLLSANDWLCVYSNITADALINTNFDLVDIDPDEFTSEEIVNIRNSGKIVIAYINIGWAENWRSYWNNSWVDENGMPVEGAAPDWLLSPQDLDWSGEYYVDYSSQDWKNMVYSSIDVICSKGFDGIYMDNIEAGYQKKQEIVDEGDLSGGIYANCTKENMITFVKEISAKYRNNSFYIIPQNGLDIINDVMDYVDGVGVEETYYVATDVKQDENVTLEKESYMDAVINANKIVLTLDYAVVESNIDDCYSRAKSRGYVPYVSVVELDRITINPGHEPDK